VRPGKTTLAFRRKAYSTFLCDVNFFKDEKGPKSHEKVRK